MVNPDVGLLLREVGLEVLGTARRSWSPRTTPRSSTAAAPRRPSRRAPTQLRAEIETTDSDWDREKLEERLAKLAGGVAVIKVGAATETALKERKEASRTRSRAAKAAVEEGIVAGGGTALVQARGALDELRASCPATRHSVSTCSPRR